MKKKKLAKIVKAQQNKLSALEKLVIDLSLRIEEIQSTMIQSTMRQQRCDCANDRNKLFAQMYERYRM